MRIKEDKSSADTILDKRRLQALGVLLPIKLMSLTFLPGRHPLGRAGEGMRFLRSRPYEPGEDNPRNIDKFSPPDQLWVNEFEAEVRAQIVLLCDMSGSMAFTPKDNVRNLSLLQLTYSLWRASDSIRTVLYTQDEGEFYSERNLKTQMEKLSKRLGEHSWGEGLGPLDALRKYSLRSRGNSDDLIFLVSDFVRISDSMGHHGPQLWRSVLRRISGDFVPVIISFNLSTDIVGSVKLWDPERQKQRLTYLTPSRIEKINEREMQRVLKVESFFRSLGLDYLIIRNERDVYPQLAKLKGLRRRRKS
jgi:uncharacterized protein (DUF58 family)